MSVEALRDVVLSIAIILWTIVVIAIAAVFFLAQRYTGRGFDRLSHLFKKKLRPALAQAQGQLQQVRNVTGNLPGGVPVLDGTARPASKRRRLSMPFRKKRRLPVPFGH